MNAPDLQANTRIRHTASNRPGVIVRVRRRRWRTDVAEVCFDGEHRTRWVPLAVLIAEADA